MGVGIGLDQSMPQYAEKHLFFYSGILLLFVSPDYARWV